MKLLLSLLILNYLAFSQEDDVNYYEHWVGQWYKLVDNKLEESPTFVVKHSLYKQSFEEYWMGAGGDFSMAWRAWDSRTKQWDFAWMSSDGLFQLWPGIKINGIWYMTKTFIIEGKDVQSRQAFIMQDENTMIRTSEHSHDNGKTWTLRFRETYRKK